MLKPTSAAKLVPPNDLSSLRPLIGQALAEREKRLGPKHPKVARTAMNLGLFLRETGDAAAAEAPLRKALEIDTANRDADLPAVQEKLAQILEVTGKHQQAYELFQQAAGGSDPSVAVRSLASLAMLDPAQAEVYCTSALKAQEAASGKDHALVAIVLDNLSLALMDKKNFASAEPLLRRALRIQQQVLGSDHYETAATLTNLGSLLHNMGRLEEAEQAEREAVGIFERKRPETRELAAAYTNLADLLAAKRNHPEAVSLLRRALAIDEAVYGLEDLEVAGDLTNLGVLLREAGDHATADSVLKRALAIYEKTLGPGSPQAIDIRENLRRSRR